MEQGRIADETLFDRKRAAAAGERDFLSGVDGMSFLSQFGVE